MEDHLKSERSVKVGDVYVPVKRKKTLDAEKVEAIAESMLEEGQRTPIQIRLGKGRVVLVEGLHRLEACKALGEETIRAIIVQARRN